MSDNEDPLAEGAAELVQETTEKFEEQKAKQEEFLESVAEEEGEPPLETDVDLLDNGEYIVPLSAKFNGDLIDRMSAIKAQGEAIEANPEEEGHEISRIGDEMCQILADVVDDPEWPKQTFYGVYKQEGPDPLVVMLERAFESLKQERERREGTAEGFRGA